MLERRKNEKNRTAIKIVADKYKMSEEDAFAIMDNAKKEYGITYFEFANKDLMKNPTKRAFERFAKNKEEKRATYIKKISQVTGWSIEETETEINRIRDIFNIGSITYYTKQLYLMTDEEIAVMKENEKKEKEEQLKIIRSNVSWSDSKIKAHIKHCRLKYGIDRDHYMAFKAWELSDEQLDTYSTVKHSKMLGIKYNKGISVLAEKEQFNKTFGDYIQRKFWINRNTSYDEFLTFAEGLDEVFCKPLDLSSGVGGSSIALTGDMHELYEEFMKKPKLLIEECVKQHHKMAEVYDGSINTVRLVTLLDKGKFIPLLSFVRFGRFGSVDNLAQGGLLAAVDEKTGTVITDAVDLKGNPYKAHPGSNIEFKGFQIPRWDDVLDIAERALNVVDSINYVGWDIAICEDKVVIIEGNSMPGFMAYQNAFAAEKKGQKYRYEAYLPSQKR